MTLAQIRSSVGTLASSEPVPAKQHTSLAKVRAHLWGHNGRLVSDCAMCQAEIVALRMERRHTASSQWFDQEMS